jgi:hypothetical protein
MIDIPRDVAAGTAVNRPLRVYAKEVFPVSSFELVVRDQRAGVFDNAFALWDWLDSE